MAHPPSSHEDQTIGRVVDALSAVPAVSLTAPERWRAATTEADRPARHAVASVLAHGFMPRRLGLLTACLAGVVVRRRMGIRGAIAAAIVAVCLTAIDYQAAPSAAARAYAAAAVKPQTIVHAVYTSRIIRADGRVLEAEHVEAWIAADARAHTVRRRRLPTDAAGRYESALGRRYAVERHPSGRVTRRRMDRRAAALNAQASSPGAVFAKLYRRGAVHEHGREVVEGRTLISFSMQDGDARMTYLVDPRTYRPVVIQVVTDSAGGARQRTVATTRVTTFDRLPDNAHNERLLTLD